MFLHMLAPIRVGRGHVWRRSSLHQTADNKDRNNKLKQKISKRFA